MPSRPRKWLRRCLFALGALLLGVVALYLLRRPLFESWIAREVGALAAEALEGDVELGAIEGNWLTHLVVRDVRVRNGRGAVRELTGGTIDAAFSPLRLARGDLGGLRALRVTVERLALDLRKGGGESTGEAGGAVDLAPFAQLLPEGGTVEVGKLELVGVASEIAGPARVRVPPHAGAPLALEIEAPQLSIAAELEESGAVRVTPRSPDLARWVGLFADLQGLAGGELAGDVRVAFGDGVQLRTDVTVRGARYRDRAIRELRAKGRVNESVVELETVVASADGLTLDVRGLRFEPARALATLTGAADLVISDLAPYADLLPADLRPMLPIEGKLQARAADGHLHVASARFTSAAMKLDLEETVLPLRDGGWREAKGGFTLVVTDGSRLPIPETAPLRVARATLRGTFETESAAAALTLDAAVTDRKGNAGTVAGKVLARLGERLEIEPDVRVSGALLRGTGSLALGGKIGIAGSVVTLDPLVLRPSTGGGVRVAGRATLAESTRATVAGSKLEVTVEAMPVAPFVPLLALPAELAKLAGTVDATARLAGLERFEVSARAKLSGLPGPGAAEVEIGARITERAEVQRLELRAAGARLSASGAVSGLTLAELVTEPAAAGARVLDVRGELTCPDASRLGLADLTGLALTGGAGARITVAGTIDEPKPTIRVEPRALGVNVADGPRIEGITGALDLGLESVRITELTATIAGHALQVTALVERDADGIHLREGRVVPALGGAVSVRGRVGGRVLEDPLGALKGDATLDVRLDGVPVAPLAALAGREGVKGTVAGSLRWGTEGGPAADIELTATVAGLPVTGARVVELEVAARADTKAVRLSKLVAKTDGAAVTANASLERTIVDLLERPSELAGAPLAVAGVVERVDLGKLDARALGLADLAGTASGRIHVRGTAAAPELTLDLDVKDADFRVPGGPRVEKIHAALAVTPNAVECKQLKAEIAAGPISVKGRFEAPGPLHTSWQKGVADFAIDGTDVLLWRKSGVKLRGDVALRARGPLGNAQLTGEVVMHSSKFVSRIPYFTLGTTGGAAVHSGITLGGVDLGADTRVGLDVRIRTKEAIAVRTNVFQGGVETALALRGTLAEPAIEGTLSVPRGTLVFPGARLRTTNALVRFDRDTPRFPRLTVRAAGRRHGIDMQMVVTGRYDSPEILLSSNPPLPSQDLLVLLTTGSRPESLRKQGSRGVGMVVGTYLVEELADYIFGSDSTEAKAGFIDRFTVESGTEISANGTESIVVEFRVLDNVFLQGERDVYEDINFGVVYRIRFK